MVLASLLGKKSGERVESRPPAMPGGRSAGPDTLTPASAVTSQASPPSTASRIGSSGEDSLDFTDLGRGDDSGIVVDVVEEDSSMFGPFLEQAAIYFASGKDGDARNTLESLLSSADKANEGEEVWLALFELYHAVGDRAAFSELEMRFVQQFERTPPIWKEAGKTTVTVSGGVALVGFRGDLVAGNDAGFKAIEDALAKPNRVRLDVSKIRNLDEGGCRRLAQLIPPPQNNPRRVRVELTGVDGLLRMLDQKLALEDPQRREKSWWLLKLECLVAKGGEDAFFEFAMAFCETFEVSPPDWSPYPADPRQSAGVVAASRGEEANVDGPGDAFVLEGKIMGGGIPQGLAEYAKGRDRVVIDCTDLERMDFVSAGTLQNLIVPLWQRGALIEFYHPPRLIARLLKTVGLGSMVNMRLKTK